MPIPPNIAHNAGHATARPLPVRRARIAAGVLMAALIWTVTAVTTAAPALAQAPVTLPAPVYFIDGASGQIVRLAADGVTRRTVTREPAPVTAFDVAPDGSKLAYVTGNRLVEAGADGLNRVVKLEGETYDPNDTLRAMDARIDAPVYAPDGARIAFARGGINLIASGPAAVGEEAVGLVLANDPLPAEGDESGAPARFFRPNSWSPDGVHLLVDYAYYPEGGGLAILAPDANVLVEVTADANALDPNAIPLWGDVAWKPDSTSFFVAGALVNYGAPGLALVDAGTGVAAGILTTPGLEVTEATPLLAVRGPHWTGGGALRAYVSAQTAVDVPAPYSLEEIDPASGERTPLNMAAYPVPETVLWGRDDSGALLLTDVQYTDGGTVGSLRWAPVQAGTAGDAADGNAEDDAAAAGEEATTYVAYGRAPRWGSGDFGNAPVQEQEVVALFDQAIDLADAQAGQDPAPFGPSVAFPVDVEGATYWVAHTTGMRAFNPDKPHAVGVFTQDGGQWQQLSLVDLVGAQEGVTAGPDHLAENGVMPVTIGTSGSTGGDTAGATGEETAGTAATQLWLHVEGGAGAHGGVCQIVRLADDVLSQELDSFSASSGACTVEDVNGDGANEVVLDATDYYVFCYACGVRYIDYIVQRWNGAAIDPAFETVTLQPLPAAAPDALVGRNDELLRLAQGELWKAALELVDTPVGGVTSMVVPDDPLSFSLTISPTAAITATFEITVDAGGDIMGALPGAIGEELTGDTGDPSGVYNWNAALVRLVGEARRADAQASDHPYPLLAQVFYGDYPAAVDVMRVYTVSEVFAQPSLLVSGTVAAGWDESLAGWLTRTASSAIGVNEQLAAAYFVRGWGEWLGGVAAASTGDIAPDAVPVPATPGAVAIDPAVLAAAVADIERALELSPDLEQAAYYAAALTLLTGEEVAAPSTAGSGSAGGLPATAPITGTEPITGTGTVTGTVTTTVGTGGQGRLLYSTVQDGEDRIYLLEFGEANATLREILGQARQPALQPGGVRLAYQSTRADMLGLGGYDLDGGVERFDFTSNLEDSLPRWNGAGERLAFSSTRYGDGRSRVYTVWADTTSEAIDQGEGSDPDWSPDGTRLVYKGCDESGANCGLWSMVPGDGGGTDRRQLTANAGDSRPRWAPDGSRVVFMSDGRDGNWDVYSVVVNPDYSGGEVTRITLNAASDGLPAVSPDGSEIVWVSNRGNQWGIWRVAIESGRAVSVVGDLGAVPNWLEQALDWVE